MKKIERLANSLIKRNKLVRLVNLVGINRIGFGSLDLLEKKFGESILKFCFRLKQELEVCGKRVLEKEDIERVIKDLEKEEEFDLI